MLIISLNSTFLTLLIYIVLLYCESYAFFLHLSSFLHCKYIYERNSIYKIFVIIQQKKRTC